MRRLLDKMFNFLNINKNSTPLTECGRPTIIGSWRLVQYTDFNNREEKPRWKEVWSFAAMDEAETHGIYVCDYINLHSVVGKWSLQEDNYIKLVRKECENIYRIVELAEKRFVLKNEVEGNYIESLIFERVV